MSSIAIIGMGRVGAATAYNLGINETVDYIYGIGTNQDFLKMQVADLTDGMIASGSKTKIIASNYSNIKDVDMVIITAGGNTGVVKSRLELFDSSLKIVKSIVEECTSNGFEGIYVIASNPVDVMAAAIEKYSGVTSNKVIGSGTVLDNARFKHILGDLLNVDYNHIEANTIGEHGESVVPLFDSVLISNVKLDEYLKAKNIEISKEEILSYVIHSGHNIFKQKQATEFGIASSLGKIINAVINDTNELLTVTTKVGVEGVGEVYIPAIASINKDGAVAITPETISEAEMATYVKSAKVLKGYEELIID